MNTGLTENLLERLSPSPQQEYYTAKSDEDEEEQGGGGLHLKSDFVEEEEHRNFQTPEQAGFALYKIASILFMLVDVVLIVVVSANFSSMPMVKMLVSLVMHAKHGFYTQNVVAEGPPVSFGALLLAMILTSLMAKISAHLNATAFRDKLIFSLTRQGLHVQSILFNSVIFAITFSLVMNVAGLEYLDNVFISIVMVPSAMFLCCAMLIRLAERTTGPNAIMVIFKTVCLLIGVAGFLTPIIVAFASIGTIRMEDLDLSQITLWTAFPIIVLVFQITFVIPSMLKVLMMDISWSLFEVYHITHMGMYLTFLTVSVVVGLETNGVFDQTASLRNLISSLV